VSKINSLQVGSLWVKLQIHNKSKNLWPTEPQQTSNWTEPVIFGYLRRVSHFFFSENLTSTDQLFSLVLTKSVKRASKNSLRILTEFYASQFYLFGWRNSSKWAELA